MSFGLRGIAWDNDLVMSGSVLKFAKLTNKAFAPTKGSEYAAGYDLRRYHHCPSNTVFF